MPLRSALHSEKDEAKSEIICVYNWFAVLFFYYFIYMYIYIYLFMLKCDYWLTKQDELSLQDS